MYTTLLFSYNPPSWMKWDEICFNGGAFGNKVSGAV